MIAMLATLVFATAGCTSAAVIGTTIRDALPAVRRLVAERGSLAEDRVYLIMMIETPRHDGTPAPAPKAAAPARVAAEPVAVVGRVRRRAWASPQPLAPAQPFIPSKLPAAA